MKKFLSLFTAFTLFICLQTIGFTPIGKADGDKKVALVLDTDVGTDDAQALLIMKNLGIAPDFIVATGGNGSADNVLRNAVILKKYLGFSAEIVRGKENTLSSEKSTFHGPDGFAGISSHMINDYGITDEELDCYITPEILTERLKAYETIEYIVIGPLTTLSYLCEIKEVNEKIDNIYLMGGGIKEFNCSHDTEFNFSKNPEAVKIVLGSDNKITLFTLDLTNHQRLNTVQIDALEDTWNLSEYIELLRYNRKANQKFNKIDAAVLHDTMPMLFYYDSSSFETQNVQLTCDEYGHLEIVPNGGYTVTYVTSVNKDLLFDEMMNAFTNMKPAAKVTN